MPKTVLQATEILKDTLHEATHNGTGRGNLIQYVEYIDAGNHDTGILVTMKTGEEYNVTLVSVS